MTHSKKHSVVMFTQDRKVDRRILLQAETLREKGLTVAIIAMPMDDNKLHHEPDYVYRINQLGNIALKDSVLLNSYRSIRRLIPMNSTLMRSLKSITWRFMLDQEAFFLKLFAHAIELFKADIYVAHDLPMLTVAHRAVQQHGGKLFYDSHELFSEQDFSKSTKKRWTDVERKYISDCAAVSTVNEAIAEELKVRYNLNKVHVLYNAEQLKELKPKSHYFHRIYSLKKEDKVLLIQGGLSSGRNIESLVKAFEYINNAHIHLVIMGSGQLKKKLQRLAKQTKRQNTIHFHHEVPQNELLNYTVEADVGIIPYTANCLNNYYCTPNKLFEFIAAGLPILANDLPEVRKFVLKNDIGKVANLGTVESIASSIDDFFSDELQLSKWKNNAIYAREKINWNVEAIKLLDIYEPFTSNEVH